MSDIIRVGYISAINYADGTAQVVYKDRDNAVSPYMPFFQMNLIRHRLKPLYMWYTWKTAERAA